MRIAIRALAIRRLSIEAIRRPKKLGAGATPRDVISDILVSIRGLQGTPLRCWMSNYVYQIPDATCLFA